MRGTLETVREERYGDVEKSCGKRDFSWFV